MVREVVFSTGAEAEVLLAFELRGDDGGSSAFVLARHSRFVVLWQVRLGLLVFGLWRVHVADC